MTASRRAGFTAIALALGLATAACGITIPADPEHTLADATGETLRAGYAPDPGRLALGEGDPRGPLADVVDGYAESIGADIEWILGSEETLATAIDQGDLDMAVGGFTEKSPWVDLAALSRGFLPPGMPDDATRSVALFPLGENALLSSFEEYVDGQGLT